MTGLETAIMVGVMALCTFATRAAAFWLFPPHKRTPRYVLYLGRVLPFAITAMLIVYCLKDVALLSWPHAIPEGIAIVVVAALYLIFKNSLLAMAAGTILYMLLLRVF